MAAAFRQIAGALLLLIIPVVSAATTTTDVELDSWHSNTGPLTTTFTPAPSCFTKRRTKIEYEGAWPKLEVGCEGPGGNECCPEGWASGRYFSPGMCPSGYQACTLPSTRQRQETTNLCCPQYVASPAQIFLARTSNTLSRHYDCPTRAGFGVCSSSLNTEIGFVFTDYYSEVKTRSWYAVTASPIQIRFQSTDSDVVPIPTDSFNLPPPPTQEELEEEERQRNAAKGLSNGAKIGIGVGSAVGGLLIIVLSWWCCCRARRAGRSGGMAAPAESILLDDTGSGRVDGDGEAPPPYTKR